MARAPTKISPPKSLAVLFPRGLTTAPAVSYFSFFFGPQKIENTREGRAAKPRGTRAEAPPFYH